MFIHK